MIAANKKKFWEQKQNSGKTSNGSKTSGSDDCHNYNQNKWGAPKNGSGIKLFRNKLMCWCGKTDCDWNTPIPQTFMVLISKAQIFFASLTFIPT